MISERNRENEHENEPFFGPAAPFIAIALAVGLFMSYVVEPIVRPYNKAFWEAAFTLILGPPEPPVEYRILE